MIIVGNNNDTFDFMNRNSEIGIDKGDKEKE